MSKSVRIPDYSLDILTVPNEEEPNRMYKKGLHAESARRLALHAECLHNAIQDRLEAYIPANTTKKVEAAEPLARAVDALERIVADTAELERHIEEFNGGQNG